MSSMVVAGAILATARLILFAVALLARLRWRVPVADLERLLEACHVLPRRARRRADMPDDPNAPARRW